MAIATGVVTSVGKGGLYQACSNSPSYDLTPVSTPQHLQNKTHPFISLAFAETRTPNQKSQKDILLPDTMQ